MKTSTFFTKHSILGEPELPPILASDVATDTANIIDDESTRRNSDNTLPAGVGQNTAERELEVPAHGSENDKGDHCDDLDDLKPGDVGTQSLRTPLDVKGGALDTGSTSELAESFEYVGFVSPSKNCRD